VRLISASGTAPTRRGDANRAASRRGPAAEGGSDTSRRCARTRGERPRETSRTSPHPRGPGWPTVVVEGARRTSRRRSGAPNATASRRVLPQAARPRRSSPPYPPTPSTSTSSTPSSPGWRVSTLGGRPRETSRTSPHPRGPGWPTVVVEGARRLGVEARLAPGGATATIIVPLPTSTSSTLPSRGAIRFRRGRRVGAGSDKMKG